MASGLTPKGEALYHWDIYALLYAPQEVYFGHETQVNVNLIETVSLPDGSERVYLSPTKRRGVERRALLYAPVERNGRHPQHLWPGELPRLPGLRGLGHGAAGEYRTHHFHRPAHPRRWRVHTRLAAPGKAAGHAPFRP
mgnify:FL=1